MTSVRPKLKPDVPKTVTAWETASGDVIYITAEYGWTKDPAGLAVFTGDAAEAALAAAKGQEGHVTDPYFMEVTADGEITGRETIRETIRAVGPSVHPQFAKTGAAQ
ncbi:MAG: DUF2849 domain-containing protein [Pseudomonadota bacterium]